MAVYLPIPGVDWRVLNVDGSGNPISATNPLPTTPGTSPANQPVVGTLTNNNAAPAATNVGSLTALANAAAPTYTEGDQVLLSTNLAGSARTMTQGIAAAGSAVAGNPLFLGVSDNTNIQALRSPPVTSGTIPYFNVAAAAIILGGGATNGPTWAAENTLSDGANGSQIPIVHNRDWNGATYDKHRSNLDVTLLASASRTTTQGPTTLITYNGGAIQFILDVTVAGTGSITLTINEVDVASGKSILLLSGAAVVTAVTNVYTVDPVVPAVANVSTQKRTPRTLSWTVTANNANAMTWSLGAMVEVT